jgi:hypothetical protein
VCQKILGFNYEKREFHGKSDSQRDASTTEETQDSARVGSLITRNYFFPRSPKKQPERAGVLPETKRIASSFQEFDRKQTILRSA